ncbi:DUF559 domain-containing protein [Acidothermaceae bacterium B102]|nr:DUF559 domain-containing protein [Acidothermaceae bacterium B102]
MKPPAPIPEPLRGKPLTLALATEHGVSRRRLGGPLFRALDRNLWVPAGTPDSLDLFIAASQLVLPEGAAVSGIAAAWLHGVDLAPLKPEPVDVIADQSWRPGYRKVLRPHRAPLPAGDVMTVKGILCTTPLRTAYDLARGPDLREAVVAVDALLHKGLITLDDLAQFAAGRSWPDGARLGRVLELADAGAESPQESRLRLVLVLDGGLPRPETQIVARDVDGRFVARLDMGYRLRRRAGIEYDGKHHAQPDQRLRDHRRHNRLVRAGWPTLYCSAEDIACRRSTIIREVREEAGL